MVIFKADHTHFSSGMYMMNTFRKDSSFCDVKLIIGQQHVKAHRCVLAAGSPYFNSLFLGQFSEASMNEINLSEVTSSVSALEGIVNFIYTGQIDIDENNLEVNIELSSFFLIENLSKFCCKFMTDNLSLTTCLRYYFYSVYHGVSEIEKKTWPMFQSRFHDHLIYEDETLGLSIDEMKFLFKKNILQHCSNEDILRFIAMWINKGHTELHIVIAKEIFDYIIDREEYPQVCFLQLTNELSFDSLCELTESTLKDLYLEGKDMFMKSFKQVLGKINKEREMHTSETRSQTRPQAKETAVIALFPSNDVMEHKRKMLENLEWTFGTFATDKHILHVCAYIPRTRCWYSLKKIYNDGSSFASLIDDSEYEPYTLNALHDELVFIDDGTHDITVNNLNNLENGGIKSDCIYNFLKSESDAMDLLNQFVMLSDFCVTAGKNADRYLVSTFRRFENGDLDRLSGIFCNGYKLVENGKMWQKLFQTETTAILSNNFDEQGYTNMYANISTVSNEMMIVYSGYELNKVLVVDLSHENTYPVTVLSSAIDDNNSMTISRRSKIIEKNDAMYIVMYIVTDGTSVTKCFPGKVLVMYEYRDHSKTLTEIKNAAAIVGQLGEIYSNWLTNVFVSELYPCLSESCASVGDGLWYMEGNDQASFLTKVTVDDNKTPVIEHHIPPPFPSITAMFASRISSEIAENKKPITRYLGNE